MKTIQKKLQTLSKVVYVFAKIGYVASIVGGCLCACAIIWIAVVGDPDASIQLGNTTVKSLIAAGDKNVAEICGLSSYLLAYCAFLAAVMRLLMRLFANMRDYYTPFTMENAKLFKRIAIWMIPAAIVPPTVGQGVGATCAKIMSLTFEAEYGDSFSLVAVLLFFVMSLVFEYGCALQEQADSTL